MSVPGHPRTGSVLSHDSRAFPFSGDLNSHSDGTTDEGTIAIGDRPYQGRQRLDSSATIQYSASPIANPKTPSRSFYHRSFHGSLDPVHYSSQSVRQQTAELASLALSDNNQGHDHITSGFLSKSHKAQADGPLTEHGRLGAVGEAVENDLHERQSPPLSLRATSALTEMIRQSPPTDDEHGSGNGSVDEHIRSGPPSISVIAEESENDEAEHNERTALLHKRSVSSGPKDYGLGSDLEGQIKVVDSVRNNFRHSVRRGLHRAEAIFYITTHPKSWNRKAIWEAGVKRPVEVLPAVFLGLLLNILDALSYGMILFPLGHPTFADLGSDGISIFYVSTIIAQLVFSCGGSIFKGGIGSEMIEVVPFFHGIAYRIVDRIGEDNPKSVLATTITAYALSSIITGAVFFLMGVFHLGSLIGFFPRHILIGCIGGVGWFLVATGIEVSARLDGNLEYNLVTLTKLFSKDTVALWLIPLALAVVLLIIKRFVHNNFLVGGYFISVAAIFYFFKFAIGFPMPNLRDSGWVFDAPPEGNPWYHFYTLYDFGAVHWGALAETIPAMFALTFFGVLHVPINVPALGISTGEDNLNVDRELIAHGVSNAVSGLAGSIQNYLVYTNSLLFIASGGNSRLAGIMLAIATFGILLAGPVIIGYIPIMVVGALIFLLGIELLEEALVDTWGRLHRLEYLTIIVIVITMGAWDFVIGILVGIILACVNFVVQTSARSAIRATYSGQVATSTVRRHPVQLRFLKDAGRQTYVIKLAGFLFFGTIVGVENRIRQILAEDAFSDHPIRFVVLDLGHVNGVDFSAAEAFTRINRLLRKKNVVLIISGFDLESDIGSSLRNVGLFNEENEVEVFADLNEALEYCENDLLKALYRRQDDLRQRAISRAPSRSLEVPHSSFAQSFPSETMFSSPRRSHLRQVAATTLPDQDALAPRPAWANFKQPLPLLLQTFEGLTLKNEDFWFPACQFFEKQRISTGTVLYHEGDMADAFLLLEDGILRAEYNMPQGRYSELIVAGRPCGELPFFSETPRTATLVAERDCVIWTLERSSWDDLQKHHADIGRELLTISLKLTKERMDTITSYVLTTAG